MEHSPQPKGWQIGLILTIGVLAASTAAILVRLASGAAGVSGVGFSLVLAASRLMLAAIVLLPTWRRIYTHPPSRSALSFAAGAGIALAIHFATWITSLAYTSIAASTTLVTISPVWVILLAWVWLHEKPHGVTLAGTGMALVGSSLIGVGDANSATAGTNPLLGDALALAGSLAASIYFLWGREAQRQGLSTSHYAAVSYTVAAIALLPLPLFTGTAYTGYAPLAYLYMVLMALLPQLIGHTSLNWSIRWVSPTFVTVAILFEPVASSLLGYWLFGEIPTNLVLAGALVLLMGVAIVGMRGEATRQGKK